MVVSMMMNLEHACFNFLDVKYQFSWLNVKPSFSMFFHGWLNNLILYIYIPNPYKVLGYSREQLGTPAPFRTSAGSYLQRSSQIRGWIEAARAQG
jgi:hypothetical protein